jgi:hypothetical protein
MRSRVCVLQNLWAHAVVAWSRNETGGWEVTVGVRGECWGEA